MSREDANEAKDTIVSRVARSWLRAVGRRPARMAAASALMVLPVALAAPARADSGPSLGGWNVSADGNVVDILIDNATGLAGIHPFTEADFPEAQSQFATGPFGSGLATVFWPGNAGGNFGSLSTELGLPAQLEPLVGKLNDPVKASAQYPSGPATATYPAGAPNGVFEMQSTAAATGTSATSSIADTGAPGVLSFSQAKGTSSSVADSTARAGASSDLTGVTLLGGIIKIGGIESTASAKSDGTTGTGSASTHVVGVTIMGQPASIGSDGLILPDFDKTFGPITGPLVQDLISQTVSALGLQITEFPAVENQNGASYTATSGGVSIKLSPPTSAAALLEQVGQQLAPLFPAQAAIIPTLPGLLQGMTITVTLGRATASAAASPPFDDSFNASALGSSGTSGTGGSDLGSTGALLATGGGDTGSASPDLGGASPALATTGGSSTAVPTGGSATARPGGTAAGLPASLVSLSSPLGAGVVVLGLIVASALGYGLWRVARLLLPEDAGTVCPLGQDQR